MGNAYNKFDDTSIRKNIIERLSHKNELNFTIENGNNFSFYDITKLSKIYLSQIKANVSEYIGINFSSPFHIISAVVATWSSGACPILLDPDSPNDETRLKSLYLDTFLLKRDIFNRDDANVETDLRWRVPEDDEFIIGFLTSGSQGEPKIILKKGYQMYRQLEIAPQLLPISDNFSAVSMVPPYHILGFFYGILLPLAFGGLTRFCHLMLPNSIRDLIIEQPVSYVIGTSVQYRVLEESIIQKVSFNSIAFFSSGSRLDENVAKKFSKKTGSSILEMYGSTETGGCAHHHIGEPWQPYPTIEFRVNKESQCLEVKSPWSETPSKWIVTNDLAEVEGNGFKLLGRVGTLVKIGGKRFSSQEVEVELKKHPLVSDAAVLPLQRYNKEPALIAFIEPKKGSRIDKNELRTFLKELIAPFKIPREIQFIEQLPKTKLNKIHYAALQEKVGKLGNI